MPNACPALSGTTLEQEHLLSDSRHVGIIIIIIIMIIYHGLGIW